MSPLPLHFLPENLFPLFLGFVGGFIDSIAGGGGLITIPALSLILGLGPETIATNKLSAIGAAGFAFFIYFKKVSFPWKTALFYTLFIGIGSFLGSQLNPYVPPQAFKYFLTISVPLVLWMIFHKATWLKFVSRHSQEISDKNVPSRQRRFTFLNHVSPSLALSGIAVGLYDGVWGPGGGTFMLLSLLWFVRLPLLSAVAVSKFANMVSAASALSGYALSGLVQWNVGLYFFLPVSIGAIIGARFASQKLEKVVRPVLAVVVVLLALKVLFDISVR